MNENLYAMTTLRRIAFSKGYAIDYAGIYVKTATLYPAYEKAKGKPSYKIDMTDYVEGCKEVFKTLQQI